MSSITHQNSQRSITASISEGKLPEGTHLRLNIETIGSTFKGYPGVINQNVELSVTDRTMITEIGTYFSGKDRSEGYILEYACEIPANPKVYKARNGEQIIVTLTIGAN
jgi:hypothetical protein